MITASFILPFMGSVSGQPGSKNKKNRMPAVAGMFYPSEKQELINTLNNLFKEASGEDGSDPLALIVPHAGYVYSGKVAASGFRMLDRDYLFRHIFVIGPAHRVYFNGIDIYTQGDFITPLGSVPIDPLADELVSKYRFISSNPGAHQQEHCIEVQLPFLQYWLKKPFKIIPVLVGGESLKTAEQLAQVLAPYFSPENLFVISCDFSHYPAYTDAVEADEMTADAIVSNDPGKFHLVKNRVLEKYGPELVTPACGWMAVMALLKITGTDNSVEFKKIHYRNSGDTSYGDRNRVVGYWSLAVLKKEQEKQSSSFFLKESDKEHLLQIARHSIDSYLRTGILPSPVMKDIPANLKVSAGAFVTLWKNNQLRGCIGSFLSQKPLYQLIQEMAVSSATNDTRFAPVSPKELEEISIEISVLTPLQRIHSVSEFKLGRDGIYMINGHQSGTFLPQVYEETHWDTEEFLGHCARDKARIGWEGWKDKNTELYTYQAIVFGEKETTAVH